jgi:hypothetical protein
VAIRTVKLAIVFHKVGHDWLTTVLTTKAGTVVRHSIIFNRVISRLNLLATRAAHLVFLPLVVTLSTHHIFISQVKTTKNEVIFAFLAHKTLFMPVFVTMTHSFLADGDFLTTTLAVICEMCCVAF